MYIICIWFEKHTNINWLFQSKIKNTIHVLPYVCRLYLHHVVTHPINIINYKRKHINVIYVI